MADVDEFGLPVEDDDNDTTETAEASEGIKSLRSALKKARSENAALQKQVTEFLAGQKRTAVADVLKAKGVNEKVAKFVLADAGDNEVNEDFVANWLKENGEIFGIQPAAEAEQEDPGLDQADRIAEASARAQSTSPQSVGTLLQRLQDLEGKPKTQEWVKEYEDVMSAIERANVPAQ